MTAAPDNQKKENLRVDILTGADSIPVKPKKQPGIIFWAIALIVVLGSVFVIVVPIAMGLASGGSTTPEISKLVSTPIVTIEPTRIIPGQDPIIGSWHWNTLDQSKTIFHTFASDGKYSNSDSVSDYFVSGSWVKNEENRYVASVHGKNITFIYQPDSDTVVLADTPELRYYPPGKGSAIITQKPTSIPAAAIPTTYYSSYSSSGSDDTHAGECYVNGYTRKDGTYVHGYYRRC